MSAWKLVCRCLRDERGEEVLNYVITVGLLVLGCVAALSMLGIRLEGRWQRLLDLVR